MSARSSRCTAFLCAALLGLSACTEAAPEAAAVLAADLVSAPPGPAVPLARAPDDPARDPAQDMVVEHRPLHLALDPVLSRDVDALIARTLAAVARESAGRVKNSDVRVSVHARDLATGAVVLARDDERPQRPASCLKLVTTAAALVLLGPGWSFETGFDAVGTLQDGVLAGDLVVRAGGDPLYAGERPDEVSHRLDEVARALAARGLQELRGDLVLDLETFPDAAPGPEWPDASQHWQEYCALAAGLSVNGGIIAARVTPGAVGAPALIEVWPSEHGLPRKYGIRTVAGTVNDVRVGATKSAATIAGAIGASLPEVVAEFAHPDPVLGFATELRAALARAGIAHTGAVLRERRSASPAEQAERLFTLRSPLLAMLEPVNAHSVNSVADHVFLALGRAVGGAATREQGGAAVAAALRRLGVPPDGLVQVDGSGLSRADRVSARQLAALFTAVLELDPATRAAFLGSLAVAGESGTLAERMEHSPARGRVFAKTGWIGGTSSLAGLARALPLPGESAGRDYVFAVLVEYPQAESGLNARCFKPMHDALAERLVAGPSAATSSGGPGGR